jgi:hypothetical protein
MSRASSFAFGEGFSEQLVVPFCAFKSQLSIERKGFSEIERCDQVAAERTLEIKRDTS